MICLNCKAEAPDHPFGELKKYCSKKCRKAAEKRRHYSRNIQWTYSEPVKIESAIVAKSFQHCQFCQTAFDGRKRKYCSPICARRARLDRMSEADRHKNAERERERRKTIGYQFVRAKRKNDPLYRIKESARVKARNAVRDGKLSKPTYCQRCNTVTMKLQGHHYRGYDRPLDVIWLCHRCHAIIETREIIRI